MGKTYAITIIQICRECEGTGQIQHPLWEIFYKKHGPPADPRSGKDWNLYEAQKQGYMESYGYGDDEEFWPPDIIQCGYCEGRGKVEVTIKKTFWQMVLFFFGQVLGREVKRIV